MPNFPSAHFGPFRLRAMLRLQLEPDEKLIGWAALRHREPIPTALSRFALAAIPGIGALLSASLFQNRDRFAILTDRRLLLFHPTSAGTEPLGSGLLLDLPLASLRVEPTIEQNAFELAPISHSSRGGVFVEVLQPHRRTHKRFIEGLSLLARARSAGSSPKQPEF